MIKQCGKTYYSHKTNIAELAKKLSIQDQSILMDLLYDNISVEFDIIKVDLTNKSISLIRCIGWDTLPEPKVLEINVYSYKKELQHTRHVEYKSNPPIYRDKWMFVSNNYNGFNIEEAKKRTELLKKSLPTYNEIKTKIGRYDEWEQLLKKYNILV